MKRHSCAQLNRPDELITGRRSQDLTARCQGERHKQSEAMRQPSGNPISNNLEETALNSVRRSMSLKDAEVSHDKTRTHEQATVTSLCSDNLESSDTQGTALPFPSSKLFTFKNMLVSKYFGALFFFLIRFPVQKRTLHFSQLDSVATL